MQIVAHGLAEVKMLASAYPFGYTNAVLGCQLACIQNMRCPYLADEGLVRYVAITNADIGIVVASTYLLMYVIAAVLAIHVHYPDHVCVCGACCSC